MIENNLLSVLFAITPVIVIFFLLAIRRTPADIAGMIGWLVTIFITWFYFKTSLNRYYSFKPGWDHCLLTNCVSRCNIDFSGNSYARDRSDCTNCRID